MKDDAAALLPGLDQRHDVLLPLWRLGRRLYRYRIAPSSDLRQVKIAACAGDMMLSRDDPTASL
jgi:hypothetical protein